MAKKTSSVPKKLSRKQKRKIAHVTITEYLRSAGTDIPGYLQIVTFMAFLAVITKTAIIIAVVTAVIFYFYNTARNKDRKRVMLETLHAHGTWGLDEQERNLVFQFVDRNLYVYDGLVSAFSGIGSGALTTLILKYL